MNTLSSIEKEEEWEKLTKESESTLESIIGSRPEVLREWESSGSFTATLPVQLHAKFWGKSLAEEEQKWRNAQAHMPLEGSSLGNERQGGYEPMDVDMSDEEDDVIEGCCFLELDINILQISRIWIRAEYIRIYDALESYYQKASRRAPAAVITGQPGIGKSMWIYYALRRRLAERKPFIWYFNETRYLFVEEGVYQVPDKFRAFKVFVWTLVDSDEGQDGVPTHLVTHNTRHFVIYCTSPSQKRWSRLHKTVEEEILIMNPWKSKEILRVIDMLPPTIKVDRGRAIDIFNQLGPIPRLCIDNLASPTQIKRYEEDVEIAITTLQLSKLEQLIQDAGSLTMDTLSHKICLISREDKEDVYSGAVVSPITSHIKSRLANHFRTLEHREQIRLYKYFSKVPELRKVAGIFFEAAAQRCFQGGVNLEFVPMVRPASGKPQWHSSHIIFPNDAELEHSRQQALQNRQPLIIPKGLEFEEYPKNGPSSPIISNVIYMPESTNQVALDSFIVMNNLIYIFQFTTGEEHKIKTGLTDFVCRYPELPSMDNWRFIVIVPPNHELLCPQPRKLEMQVLQPYSAVIDPNEWYLGRRTS